MPESHESPSAAADPQVSPTRNMFRTMLDLKSSQHSAHRTRPHAHAHSDTAHAARVGLSLATDASSLVSLVLPVSPEFDSITSLPTPVVANASPSALSEGFTPIKAPPRNGAKKSYGALTTRGSVLDRQPPANRNVSEYGSTNSMNRYSNASTKTSSLLNPRLNGTLRSPQKRTVSTPLHEHQEGLEREELSLQATHTSPTDVLYPGVDNHGDNYTWKQVRELGRGTFSTVLLGQSIDPQTPQELQQVAIKVVELPPQRDTRTRVESSLRRELEVLKALKHPSIIKLLALSTHTDQYCIITPLCEGGDLFELAAKHRDRLKPQTIRRIFAEVACAVAYLHKNNIVHRDIKLENVLVNMPFERLVNLDHFGSTPLITLTDFGLSRTIDPESPLLTTRCGSEDYVPPELLIGLPYDGRQSDSWALGVLLYAIMESRLPFDPPPSKSIRARSKVAHRIARIEWAWSLFDDENKGVSWKEQDWTQGKWIVENLLVRREKRITSREICVTEWVDGILPTSFKKA